MAPPEPANLELGLEKRKFILSVSLKMEGLTSAFLATLVGINDIRNSRVLGNKGSAISFGQKIDFLIEIGALNGEDRAKFFAFMEIRNQFMHNLEASTYEKCYSFLDNRVTYIFKLYPHYKNLPTEEGLERATTDLANEVLQKTLELIEALKAKAHEHADIVTTKKSHQAFEQAIPQIQQVINEFVEKLGKEKELKIEMLRGLGDEVGKTIYKLWLKNFNKISEAEKEQKVAKEK